MFDVFVISIANPLLIGVYDQHKLIETYEKEGFTSDILPLVFKEILDKYSVHNLYYVNGPGSYMSIKVAYVFLKTLAITHQCELKAANGFHFNHNSAIKALGKKYFINENHSIIIDFLKEGQEVEPFKLPNVLKTELFTQDSLPQYNLPAV